MPMIPRTDTVHLRMRAWLAASALALAWVANVHTVAIAAAGSPVDYAKQVKPILTGHCVTCHGAAKPKGGLRLDTAAAALLGGESGPVVVPGRGEESPLIAA